MNGPVITAATEGHAAFAREVEKLTAAGLTAEEAALIAHRRLHDTGQETGPRRAGRSMLTLVTFTALGGVLVHVPRLIAESVPGGEWWLMRGVSLFVLPVLLVYLAVQRRRVTRALALVLALAGLTLAAAATLFPFEPGAGTGLIMALHLPVLLWFGVGVAYVGGFGTAEQRMEFVRFCGEWVVYYALIALGGGVLLGLTAMLLAPIAPDSFEGVVTWVLPSGIAGATIVAAWLAHRAKQSIATTLSAVFTPLFGVLLLACAIGYTASFVNAGAAWTFDRDLLVVLDLLLLVVVALVVYGTTVTRASRIGLGIRIITVLCAILVDVLVLATMLARLGEFGLTANRFVATALNILLLINLIGAAWIMVRMFTGRAQSSALERWQAGHLPVFAGWLAIVVLAVPPMFGFA